MNSFNRMKDISFFSRHCWHAAHQICQVATKIQKFTCISWRMIYQGQF